jgi:uncharacterized protein (TIGR03435 family)
MNRGPLHRSSFAGKLFSMTTRTFLFVPIAIGVASVAQTVPTQTMPTSFEVASIKLMDTKNPHPPSVNIAGDQFSATGMTMKELIKIAYDLNYGADRQVSGGPAWLGSTRFDIEAKEDPAVSAELQKLAAEQRGDRLRQMLRSLLADRFKLQLHHESTELPVYELVLAKGGSKLMPSVPPVDSNNDGVPPKPRSSIRFAGKGRLEGNDADLPMLVTALCMQPEVGGRLVVDKTGLTGKFDFTLKWTPDLGTDQPAADAGPSLFTALQDELGFRLQPTKAPVDVLVIDRVEMPSEN